jgi:multiple sugar transport system permease protein
MTAVAITARGRKRINKVIIVILDVIVLFIFDFPILWMFLSALKREEGMFSMPPKLFFVPTLFNYFNLVERGAMLYFKNSLTASLATVFVATIIGIMAGYGLARGKFRAKKNLAWWIISTRMAPMVAVILPLYIIFRNLGMLNTLTGLVVGFTTFTLPFATWLMMGFFQEIPRDLEEAALVDGADKPQAFFYVALPLVTPGIVATAVLCFVFAWNDYLFATVLTSSDTQTLPVVTSALQTMRGILWGQVMSMGTLIFVPVLLIGIAIRKYLVRGLTMGAIK